MIYKGLLIIAAIVIWSLLIMAKLAEYDMNYGFFIFALIASIIMSIFIIGVGFARKQIIKSSMYSTILFLITSSPISLFVFVWLYQDYIGQYMKL